MSPKMQASLLWVIAVIVTLSSVVYQRQTGPTYPVDGSLTHVLDDGSESRIMYSLITSEDTGVDAEVNFEVMGAPVEAELTWKRYKSHDEWQTMAFAGLGDVMWANLPTQPPAGKIIYTVDVIFADGSRSSLTEEPVTIRYKGSVPAAVLIPHILLMFTSMLVSTRTGLAAWVNSPAVNRYAWITFATLMLGGMILGPVVQKYAFDAYWTGWPFGHDLTDNKTLAAVIAWILALWKLRQNRQAKWWVIGAAVVQLLVYLIPHSVLGSELDYTQMEN